RPGPIELDGVLDQALRGDRHLDRPGREPLDRLPVQQVGRTEPERPSADHPYPYPQAVLHHRRLGLTGLQHETVSDASLYASLSVVCARRLSLVQGEAGKVLYALFQHWPRFQTFVISTFASAGEEEARSMRLPPRCTTDP